MISMATHCFNYFSLSCGKEKIDLEKKETFNHQNFCVKLNMDDRSTAVAKNIRTPIT